LKPPEDRFVNDACFVPVGAARRPERSKWNVLVVDDEDPVRELVAYVLESHGFSVYRARHSREALFLHSGFTGDFHLLWTDICMNPHADGFDLARALRRDRPQMQVIYSSGFVEPDRLKREVEAFGALFLPKPFTPAALLDCVLRSLQLSPA
jgi:two-component system, cell cycle sensor histidine kinase and response regulator CckA